MYKFKEIQLSADCNQGEYIDSIQFELPNDSNIVKVSYNYTNYLGAPQLSLLYTTHGSEINEEYNLGLFRHNQNIFDTFIYVNSFTDDSNFEFHVCYQKEQN